jgi:hypothetical protein
MKPTKQGIEWTPSNNFDLSVADLTEVAGALAEVCARLEFDVPRYENIGHVGELVQAEKDLET